MAEVDQASAGDSAVRTSHGGSLAVRGGGAGAAAGGGGGANEAIARRARCERALSSTASEVCASRRSDRARTECSYWLQHSARHGGDTGQRHDEKRR